MGRRPLLGGAKRERERKEREAAERQWLKRVRPPGTGADAPEPAVPGDGSGPSVGNPGDPGDPVRPASPDGLAGHSGPAGSAGPTGPGIADPSRQPAQEESLPPRPGQGPSVSRTPTRTSAPAPPAMTGVPTAPPEPPRSAPAKAVQTGSSPAQGGQQERHGAEAASAAPGPWALADVPAGPRTDPAAPPPLPSGPPGTPSGQSGAETTLPWTSSSPDPSSGRDSHAQTPPAEPPGGPGLSWVTGTSAFVPEYAADASSEVTGATAPDAGPERATDAGSEATGASARGAGPEAAPDAAMPQRRRDRREAEAPKRERRRKAKGRNSRHDVMRAGDGDVGAPEHAPEGGKPDRSARMATAGWALLILVCVAAAVIALGGGLRP